MVDTSRDAMRPFRVIVYGVRVRQWSRYQTFAQADEQAQALRRIGMDAHVFTDEEPPS